MLAAGCGQKEDGASTAEGPIGGASVSGGAGGAGPALAGGTAGSGGSVSSGGVASTGGARATGGLASTGGDASTGGLSSVGGTSLTGGLSSVGGAAPAGGGSGPGGAPAGGAPTGGQGAAGAAGAENVGGTAAGGELSAGAGGGGGGGAGAGGAGGAGGDVATGGCTVGDWGTADPTVDGPFETVIETPVGPGAGILEDGVQPQFTVIRPTDLGETERCHPLITWGNGHGDNPPTYMVLLRQLASQGFVVVASLTRNASQGDPLPQVAGIDWILEENDTPSSLYYRRIDTAHIGATGHSEGGFATTRVGADPRVKAIATLCGAAANADLQCPALFLCGGADTIATCSGMQAAFDGSPAPVMLASQLTATHGSWIGSIRDPFMIAVTAWMRLHLMGDAAQAGLFYGADCELCTNTAVWDVLGQKGMEQYP